MENSAQGSPQFQSIWGIRVKRAIAVLDAANPDPERVSGGTSGGILFIPTGRYSLSQPVVIKRPVIIQGSGLHSTTLIFQDLSRPSDETIPGIIFESEAGYSTVRDLAIVGVGGKAAPSSLPRPDDSEVNFPDGTSHSGLVLHTQALIENCFITGFQHDGIHINTSLRGNANNWQVRNCLIETNHRHGMFVTGGDSGVGCAIGVKCSSNDRFGVYDKSFAGNVYIACVAQENRGGGYKFDSVAAQNFVALGCESEGNENFITYPAIAIGGSQIDGWIVNPTPSVRAPVMLASSGPFAAVSVRATGVREINNSSLPDNRVIGITDSVILANAGAGPLDVTLPSFKPSDLGLPGFTVTVKKIDKNKAFPVSILLPADPPGSIDGQKGISPLTEPFSWITLLYARALSGTSDWYVIGTG